MKIRIYQINNERDDLNVAFLNLENLQHIQGSKELESRIYDQVYEGKVDCKSLENVYEKFNIDFPSDFHSRSLSVSDVVEVVESDEVKKGFYFCDSIGFERVDFDPEKAAPAPQREGDGKISVLLVQPGKYPEIVEIDDTLESMQKTVGGDIEEYMPFEDDVAIICNEEGKIRGLPLNRAVYDQDREMVDIVAGDFFIAYAPVESEKFLSLPKDMAEKYSAKFKYPEHFIRVNGEIQAIPFKPAKTHAREESR